jgi:hypothetical protein
VTLIAASSAASKGQSWVPIAIVVVVLIGIIAFVASLRRGQPVSGGRDGVVLPESARPDVPASELFSDASGEAVRDTPVGRAVSALPGPQTSTLATARPHLVEAARRIKEDVLGILQSEQLLVITSSRIVTIGCDGAIEIWPYVDIRQLWLANGGIIFCLVTSSERRLTAMLYGNRNYEQHVSMLAQDAWRKALLSKL